MKLLVLFSALALAVASHAQSQQDDAPARTEKPKKPKKSGGHEIGSGLGSAAGGVAKGAGNAAAGAGNAAADLATLHPIDAGVAAGTGAAKAGKDVTVGSAKGAGKIGKGVGHVLRKVF